MRIVIVSKTKKYNIVIEDSNTFTDKVWLFELSKGIKKSCEIANISHALLEVIHKKLSGGNGIVPVGLETSKKQDDEKILYRPYESFTRSNEWMAGRYVGEVSFKLTKEDFAQYKLNTQEPKIFTQEPILLSITPRFGTPFLCHMLEEIYNFKMPESAMQNGEGVVWNKFYQLILRQLWIAKFAKADKYGLPRHTVKRTHQGLQIRGHLNVRKSILPFFTKKEVVSEYREKEVDDMIGRIVYKAYDILADKETGLRNLPPQVQESINNLYSRYHGEQIKITEHDYQSIRYKSIYVSWKPLVDFSWQIIKHRGYNPEQSIDEQGYGLFFDMAEIWEAFLREILRREFPDWQVSSPEITVYEGCFYERRIIPDIVLSRGNDVLVFDAKWKRMNAERKTVEWSDLDRSDFFQIHTYIQYYKTIGKNVIAGGLLYPLSIEEFKPETMIASGLFGEQSVGTRFVVDGIAMKSNEIKDREGFEKSQKEFLERFSELLTK